MRYLIGLFFFPLAAFMIFVAANILGSSESVNITAQQEAQTGIPSSQTRTGTDKTVPGDTGVPCAEGQTVKDGGCVDSSPPPIVDLCSNIPGPQLVAPDGLEPDSEGRCVPPEADPCRNLAIGDPGVTADDTDKAARACVGTATYKPLQVVWSYLWLSRFSLLLATIAFFVVWQVLEINPIFAFVFAILAFVGGGISGGTVGDILSTIGITEWPGTWKVPMKEIEKANPFISIIIGGGFILFIAALAALTWFKQLWAALGLALIGAAMWGFATALPDNNPVKGVNKAVEEVLASAATRYEPGVAQAAPTLPPCDDGYTATVLSNTALTDLAKNGTVSVHVIVREPGKCIRVFGPYPNPKFLGRDCGQDQNVGNASATLFQAVDTPSVAVCYKTWH